MQNLILPSGCSMDALGPFQLILQMVVLVFLGSTGKPILPIKISDYLLMESKISRLFISGINQVKNMATSQNSIDIQ